MLLLPLMFVCYTFSVTKVNSQIAALLQSDTIRGFCCNNDTGPTVKTAYTTMAQVVSESPNYEHVVTNSFYTQMLDNVCHTYFAFDNSSYLRFTGLTYADNTFVIQKFIASEIPSVVGVSRVQGIGQIFGSSSVVYDEVYLGSTCNNMRVYYRNYIAGRSDILAYATLGDTDFVHGDSPDRDPPDCVSQVEAVASLQNIKRSCFSSLPNKCNRHCVNKWNGASCINAYKVLPQDAYTLPDYD